MKTFRRALEVRREEGWSALIKRVPPSVYMKIWPVLPETENIILNGITCSQRKRLPDDLMPSYLLRGVPSDDPNYEEQYVACLRETIGRGDRVVLIGGGEGVSAVIAAKQTQSGGAVQVYEGGTREVEKSRETARINEVDEVVSVDHAIVSDDISLRSEANGASVIPAQDLPNCDVLAIDADGAEIPILKKIDTTPRYLVVEHHVVFDGNEKALAYQPATVRSLIEDRGYEIINERSDPTRAYGEYEERIFVAGRSDG